MCDATSKITRASQGAKITINFALLILAVLATVTVSTAVEYYRQLGKAQREYEKAKGIVEDIVLSFDRELRREAEKLDLVAFKVEGNLAKADTSLKKADNLEKRLEPFENQIETVSQSVRQTSTSILSGLTTLESKIIGVEATQQTLNARIAKFEEQFQKFTATPETMGEPSMPVIPIKRDKAMATLTDTEIQVLEMLSSEGPKTAPEIKDRVHLSREHTARLMKKLYEEGYLEREERKIPFRYSIKAEMEKLLKKTENA
ncbi:MAG TPA: MarR family transcriptional regulator [Candidatus Limnocylindrales bacterium]|nr:MarR family transcriptional regulator [Candidatus Limnocylindrales bacterium]